MKMNVSPRLFLKCFVSLFPILLILFIGGRTGDAEPVPDLTPAQPETFSKAFDSNSASDSRPESSAKHEEIPWIYVPVDADGKPVDEELYVPLEIFQEHSQGVNASEKGPNQSFFFRNALYTGTVSQNLASRVWNVDSIRASFEVEVRIPKTKVTFPFTQSEVYLVPGSAVLNGEAFQVVWEDGHPVANFPKTGRYLLEFTLIPIVVPMEPVSSSEPENMRLNGKTLSEPSKESSASSGTKLSMSGFRFSIPVIPDARLELQVPQGIGSIEFPMALGGQEYEQNTRTWLVHLGPTPQLTVQWKTQHIRTGTPGLLTAEELCKWRLEEKSQRLECRTRFHSSEETFSRMEWVIDSNLIFNPEELQIFIQTENSRENPSMEVGNKLNPLVPSNNSRSPDYFFVPFSGEKNIQTRFEGNICRIILTLAKPVSEPLLVIFPLENTSVGNVGSYRIPLVRTEKTKVTHRWFQVISEPNFRLELTQAQPVSLISPQEFFSVWEELSPISEQNPEITGIPSELDDSEDSAFTSGSSLVIDDSQPVGQAPVWTVKSGPLPSISTIRENLSCAFDKDLVTVQLFVEFSNREAIPSLFHLHVPEGFNIQKVILHDGMAQKNLRFSHGLNEQIGIFYDKISPGISDVLDSVWKEEFSSISNPVAESQLTSVFPEAIPSPVVKRSAVVGTSSVCSVEILGTLDVLDFTQKKETNFPFPDVHVTEPTLHSVSRTVQLFRTSRVLVTCPIPDGCREIEEAVSPATSERFVLENVRKVSAFSVPPQEILKTNVQVLPNQPRVLMNARTFLRIPRELALPEEKEGFSSEATRNENDLPSEKSNVSVPEISVPSQTVPLPRIPTAALPNESQKESPVYSSNSHWQMTMEMLLTVEKGLADEIVLEMPASFSQPYVLEPPMPYVLEPISNQEISVESVPSDGKNGKTAQKKSRNKKLKKDSEASSGSTKTEKEKVPDHSATDHSATSTKSGAWVRMIIHPQKPISGNLALRLTADIQESSLDSSVQNALVRLSNFRFPGITVQKQDILLPALRSESPKEQFRWFTDGMIPLSLSRLEIPSAALGSGDSPSPKEEITSESAGPKFENPFTLAWKAPLSSESGEEKALFKIYRVIEEHYAAQLQIQSFDWLNPSVELTSHSIYWNPDKEFLGVTTLDVLPQKAQTCILRIPVKMKLLELHLDSRPVQMEEVVWDENYSEFLPISSLPDLSSTVQEKIHHSSTEMAYRTFRVTLRSLQLPQHLEVLYHGNVADWQTFRLPGSTMETRAEERLFQLDLPVLLQQQGNEIVPIESRSGAVFFFMPNDSRLNLWSVTLPETVSGIRTQRLAPLAAKPWGRVQLVCLERLRELLTRVLSPRLAGSVTQQERTAWLENWYLLLAGVEHLIERTFSEHPEFAGPEMRQNFERLRSEYQGVFADALPHEALEKENLIQQMNEFRQNSLWLIFIRNLPNGIMRLTAFETGSGSQFYMLEKTKPDFTFPRYSWVALYTLLFTLMISLGLYFHPAIPEEVRSTPFWLICAGSLWLFCGLNVWIGLLLLTLSVVTLSYRIWRLRKSGI